MMENAEQLTSVPGTFTSADSVDYVTVVSVGSNEPAVSAPLYDVTSIINSNSVPVPIPVPIPIPSSNYKSKEMMADYVTVLKIGNNEGCLNTVTEETFVYRLPGEKLGFGLKFEGGTKPDEFVKRLFIQSCAVNSPASRVQSSWGSLTEGDEVLDIDSVPVNSMTRIDCVRCLKNSNVVIKLLIRHRFDTNSNDDKDSFVRSTEDLPLVVSAEKKRTPPPPPPVPPRKINRKTKEAGIFIPPKGFDDTTGETNHSLRSSRYGYNDNKNHGYVNSRKGQPCPSPEVSKSVRRRDIANPPDAEVYTDLFTQESTYSLSESDDTGSSISTVVDRLGSFPTTTNSSFAGSLPSTPTPIQRHIDLTDDIDFSCKLTTSQAREDDVDGIETSIRDRGVFPKTDELPSGDNAPLQPPANFQDAPLSYGNEHVPVIKHGLKYLDFSEQKIITQPPPPPPRNKNQIFINIGKPQTNTDCQNPDGTNTGTAATPNLPRLVDFVPKCNKRAPIKEVQTDCETTPNTIEIVARFLENEKQAVSYLAIEDIKNEDNVQSCNVRAKSPVSDAEAWNEDDDVNSFGWNLPSKLATIGEDAEEEVHLENLAERKSSTSLKPMVRTKIEGRSKPERIPVNNICAAATAEETVDDDAIKDTCDRFQGQITVPAATRSPKAIPPKLDRFDVDAMDSPPIYSRQPPDGHEFPDYQEVLASPAPVQEQVPRARHRSLSDNLLSKSQPDKNSVRDKIAIFSNASAPTLTKKYTSSENIMLNSSSEVISDGLGKQQKTISKSELSLDNLNGFPNEFSLVKLRNPVPPSDRYPDEKTQSTTDLSVKNNQKDPLPRLHVRSQSLTNMTLPDLTHKQDRWSLLVEQRRKGLSKLKDLVIPEHVAENDTNVRPVLDLPEIKSNIFPSVTRNEQKNKSNDARKSLPVHIRNSSTSCLASSPWFSKPADTMPKYSPAFKRKSLQIYGASLPVETKDATKLSTSSVASQSHATGISEEARKATRPTLTSYKVNEVSKFEVNISVPIEAAPKSLESITSPTRSDCSFEYVSSPEFRIRNATADINDKFQQTIAYTKPIRRNEAECVGRSEDDSDSDSALSSSQSSYVSKNSSTDSPVQLQIEYTSHALCSPSDVQANERHYQTKNFQNSCQLEISNYDSLSRRLLKPQSVEAINRKNILASAKCRSGRDLKVGSPLIQRKFEEDGQKVPTEQPEQTLWECSNQLLVAVDGESQDDVAEIKEEEISEKEDDVAVVVNNNPEEPIAIETPLLPQEVSVRRERKTSSERLPIRETVVPIKKPSKSSRIVTPATSVTDLRKNFERAAPPAPMLRIVSSPAIAHQKVTTPTEEIVPTKRSSLPIIPKIDLVKQDTISDQATEKIICDTLGEFGDSISKKDLKVIILKPEILGGSLGITLAGGADYETKEITVHKIRNGSLAFKDGRLRKGDKILAINGKFMKGLSHGESIAALKEIVPEVIIVACKAGDDANIVSPKVQAPFKFPPASEPEKGLVEDVSKKGEIFEVTIEKDAAGLGFSIQGGKGSVQGDVPLTIKKLFMGGPAERSGKLKVGDELMDINRTAVASMSRIDAWNLMKKLPEGEVVLVIRR